MTPPESSPRDLQSETGPGAVGAQEKIKNRKYLLARSLFLSLFVFRVSVLSPFRICGGFRSS